MNEKPVAVTLPKCSECDNEHHHGTMRCECGSCLYKNGTQKGIPQKELEMYPFLKCTVCSKVSFCD